MATNEEIYKLLLAAKVRYNTRPYNTGMCHPIGKVAEEMGLADTTFSYTPLYEMIPEFNYEFLGGDTEDFYGYWWDLLDKETRLQAFDKLIKLYKFKIEPAD